MQREESKLQSSCLFNEQHVSCTFKKVGASAGGNIVFMYHKRLQYNIKVPYISNSEDGKMKVA